MFCKSLYQKYISRHVGNSASVIDLIINPYPHYHTDKTLRKILADARCLYIFESIGDCFVQMHVDFGRQGACLVTGRCFALQPGVKISSEHRYF